MVKIVLSHSSHVFFLMIIPAILEQTVEEVQKKIDRVHHLVPRVQIDIIDQHQTATVDELEKINFYNLAVDIHLMTDDPEKFLEQCAEVARKTDCRPLDGRFAMSFSAEWLEIAMTSKIRVIGQIERMMDQGSFVRKAHGLKLEAGLALDLYTPISSLDINARESADCILLMSVKAGFAGQRFDERVIEKIKELRDTPYKGAIVIDGGLDLSHLQVCKSAGANEFAVGSYLWEHEDIARVIASDLMRLPPPSTNAQGSRNDGHEMT